MRRLLEAFLERMQRRNYRPRTLYRQRWFLERFVAFVGDLPSSELTREHLIGYRLFLQSQPELSHRTVFDRCANVRKWLRWAFREDLLLRDPSAGFIEKAPARKIRRVPTQGEVKRLLDAPRKTQVGRRDQVLMELIYGTGLRNGEVCALNLLDFDRSADGLWVRRGKGGKDRLAPIGPYLLKVLEGYFQHSRPHFKPRENAIFVTSQGWRLTQQALSLVVRTHARKVGLDGVCAHSLRHAFATHLLEGGASLLEVKLLLGHSRLGSTQIYTRVVPLEFLREYQRTHPRAKHRAH